MKSNLNKDNQFIMNMIDKNMSSEAIDTITQLLNDKRKLERDLLVNVSNRKLIVSKTKASKSQNSETHHTRNKRKKRSNLVIALEQYLSEACYTRKQIIDMCMFKCDCKISTVRTYLTDSKNVKYNVFSSLVNEDAKTKIMHFVNVKAKTIDQLAAIKRQEQINAIA